MNADSNKKPAEIQQEVKDWRNHWLAVHAAEVPFFGSLVKERSLKAQLYEALKCTVGVAGSTGGMMAWYVHDETDTQTAQFLKMSGAMLAGMAIVKPALSVSAAIVKKTYQLLWSFNREPQSNYVGLDTQATFEADEETGPLSSTPVVDNTHTWLTAKSNPTGLEDYFDGCKSSDDELDDARNSHPSTTSGEDGDTLESDSPASLPQHSKSEKHRKIQIDI